MYHLAALGFFHLLLFPGAFLGRADASRHNNAATQEEEGGRGGGNGEKVEEEEEEIAN